MLTSVSRNINNRAMEIASPFRPKLSDYDNGKDFNELFYSGVEFVQVFLYDRHDEPYASQSNFNMDIDKQESFLHALNIYKQELEKAVVKAIDEMGGLSNYDKFNYSYNNRVGSDFGYCHVNTYVRSEAKDRREEEERNKRYKEYHEPSCSSCGDGGCVHCEPSRFIEGYIGY
jgi:hypothetical protein